MSEEGSKLIIVANRLPVRQAGGDGPEQWKTSPGGLVSALMPILRRESASDGGGAWIGWSGGAGGRLAPFTHEGVFNVPVNLSEEQIHAYYEGMANGTLWPLFHDVVRPPTFETAWWRTYQEVNSTFAKAAASVAGDRATVWVQDYHLTLVPRMLRMRRPDLKIGFFLHIPFPDQRLFGRLPWRREIVAGILGADVAGFQTKEDAEHFASCAARYGGAVVEGRTVTAADHETHVAAYPISIDAAKIDKIARSEAVMRAAAEHRRRLGERTVLLGVDRLDYTKGIPNRLRAFQRLLRSGRVSPDEVTLVQSCVPTRENIPAYAKLRSDVEQIVGEINGEFSPLGRECVHYLRQNLPLEELIALYVSADIALVTPLRDGMNLIAKEFVAARHEELGTLVLSECTGAAEELPEAITVNPHDLEGMARVFERAMRIGREEQRRRMRAMRATVTRNDVYHWADGFMGRLRPERSATQRRSRPARAAAVDDRSRALAPALARSRLATAHSL